jgi:hypothetical protein
MSLFDRVSGQNMQSQLQQLQNDPGGMAQKAGYNIPPNLYGNPQAMVQHLIQTGQVSNPMLQKIMPMIQRMGGK